MSNDPQAAPHALPDRPNLRHLKDQAKDLVKAGTATSITDAQFKIARLYGFPSWPKLKAHLESLEEAGQLKQAIDRNDIERVKTMMTRNPALHRAPLGYGKDGPLTWVAECRVPWGPPSPTRLEMAKWMIENGSDVHQGGDGPLMRAALKGNRIPMMELLVSYGGADVNAEWHGDFPIIFAPCEAVDPEALKWLLDRGANPNCVGDLRNPVTRGTSYGRGTALDYVIGTYARSPERLSACIDVLLEAGGTTRYNVPGVLEVLRRQLDRLAEQLDADSTLAHRRFPELDCGSTGGRRLLLQGATLLHVAAEFGNVEAAKLLLDRGADINARATVDDAGVGGQTAIFHAVTQFGDDGLPMAQFLVERGADLSVRVKLPGHYERLDEVVECTPLSYALRFQDESHSDDGRTVAFLRERGAIE
jgi:ankyrin repeat protein